MPSRPQSLFEVITAAVRDIAANGFDSPDRVLMWMDRLRQAAYGTMVPERTLQDQLVASLKGIYTRQVDGGGLFKRHKGVSRFTVEKLKPKMRQELDRRIMASANLIKLNREQAIAKTLQRFSGWATSIPTGGSDVVDKVEVKGGIKKALSSLPFEERRVLIDQGHKLLSAIDDIVADDSGAIAAVWHSHWRESGYNYRRDHKARDQKVYALRGNWAAKDGLMKAGPAGFYDDITKPGEEVYCRCYANFLYNIKELPADMLTAKGKAAIQQMRVVK